MRKHEKVACFASYASAALAHVRAGRFYAAGFIMGRGSALAERAWGKGVTVHDREMLSRAQRLSLGIDRAIKEIVKEAA